MRCRLYLRKIYIMSVGFPNGTLVRAGSKTGAFLMVSGTFHVQNYAEMISFR